MKFFNSKRITIEFIQINRMRSTPNMASSLRAKDFGIKYNYLGEQTISDWDFPTVVNKNVT